MRALIALLLSLWLAPAWAQVPMTGAGKGTPGASAVFAITYGSEVEDNTSQTSYSLASVQAGSGAGSNGYPVIAVCIRSANAVTTPTVTWGGGATTKVVEMMTGSGPTSYVGLFQYTTSTAPASTATVAISSFGSTAARAAAAGYMVATNTSAVPSGAAVSAASISGNDLTGSVTVPSNGRAILAGCVATIISSSITAPASNITQDLGKNIGASATWVNAGHDTADRSGATTYTVQYNASASAGAGVIAAWAP